MRNMPAKNCCSFVKGGFDVWCQMKVIVWQRRNCASVWSSDVSTVAGTKKGTLVDWWPLQEAPAVNQVKVTLANKLLAPDWILALANVALRQSSFLFKEYLFSSSASSATAGASKEWKLEDLKVKVASKEYRSAPALPPFVLGKLNTVEAMAISAQGPDNRTINQTRKCRFQALSHLMILPNILTCSKCSSLPPVELGLFPIPSYQNDMKFTVLSLSKVLISIFSWPWFPCVLLIVTTFYKEI